MNDLFWLLLLLVLSGFFSGAEIALFSLGPERIKALKDKAKTKKRRNQIKRLEILKSDPDKLLVTILLGNNVVNVASSAIATILAQQWAASAGYGEDTALVLGVVTGVMTFLILLFGEIVPKSFCHRNALPFSLFACPIIYVLETILWPLVAPLSRFVQRITPEEELLHGLSEDELKAAVALAEEEGHIESDEKKWVERILEFDDYTVAAIMAPRSRIFALEDTLLLEEALKEVCQVGYSRIPVYHEDLDEVVGILSVRTILGAIGQKNWEKKKIKALELWEPLKIPITMKIDTVLETFQREKTHLALVYDEYGGLVGLVTLEDVLEEIFGEIQDEEDEESLDVRLVGQNLLRISGDTELEQIEHFIEEFCPKAPAQFPWKRKEENKTLGLFLLEQFEKFPELDEVVTTDTLDHEFTFIVKKVEEGTIYEVEMTWKAGI